MVSNEEKRLQSIKQKIASYRQQQSAIKIALQNVDTSARIDKKNTSNGIDKTEHTNKKRKILFDSDEEEEDHNFDNKLNNSYDNKTDKLFTLQASYKGDKRFTLNENFIESDNENHDSENESAYQKETLVEDLEEEKKRQIDILQSVLGNELNTHPQKKRLSEKKMLRFDPTKSDHTAYELKTENVKNQKDSKSKKKKKNEKNSEEQSNEPQVSKNVFYKVNEELKTALEKKEEFSLLSTFGTSFTQEKDENVDEVATEINNKSLLLDKNPFRYDSSDDEDEEVQDEEIIEESTKSKEKNVSVSRFRGEPFFFKEDDYRLQEGVDFLRRVSSEASDFLQQRSTLKHIVRNKVRRNQLKKTQFKKKLGGNKKKKMLRMKKALKR